MDTQIAYKCGLHKHRSPEAARECFLKNFFVNFEQSRDQLREQRREREREQAASASPTKQGIHLVTKEQKIADGND
jgi:hypothetical protein